MSLGHFVFIHAHTKECSDKVVDIVELEIFAITGD